EAIEETERMLDVYATFVENWLALPVIKGKKTPNERFAGAIDTYCIEAMMQDGQALQAGTSHYLGQNFAKAFDVKFLNKEGKQEFVYATSWGVSTRLIGALIMAHSDDDGLVLPPMLAPIQVVIVPIAKGEAELQKLFEKFEPVIKELKAKGISVKFDDDDTKRPGFKFAEYELKGVPVRLAMGMRDYEAGTVEVARRDTKEKSVQQFEGIAAYIEQLLTDIQANIFNKAKTFRDSHIREVNTWDEFLKAIEEPGFISAHWDGTPATEEKIKELTKATIRCIPLNNPQQDGKCVFSGQASKERVIFSRAY
ncbi:MAG TPA: His/Gly/Thr/Pro-type tRNA ligase C-terminal domain-containing protein, partial [Chitinophagales bacterium]|nr:His/Gly/Thr/Pro-type tRNA ligase C-terminal domain-containing protein [Chitinophagales bacterium]